jgi:hypothetical protein
VADSRPACASVVIGEGIGFGGLGVEVVSDAACCSWLGVINSEAAQSSAGLGSEGHSLRSSPVARRNRIAAEAGVNALATLTDFGEKRARCDPQLARLIPRLRNDCAETVTYRTCHIARITAIRPSS